MRTIKFRGKSTEKGNMGKLVYGDLVQWGGFGEGRICSWENGVIYDVEEDSIAQLVGVDSAGNEVYEGDKLLNPRDGTTFKAAMNHIYTVKSYTLKD